MVDRLSKDEASCLSSDLGDAGYQSFLGASLMASIADASTKSIFADCLEGDNLPVLGVRVMSAHLGGWSEDSLGCVSDLSRTHHELVYLAFGVEEKFSDPSHPTEVHSIILDMYECLDTEEKTGFSVALIFTTGEVAPFTGQHFLEALPGTELECLKTNLPAPVFAMIADAPSIAGGELRDAPPQMMACISAESLNRLPAEIMAHGLGAESEESIACIIDFTANHSHYIELTRTAAADPAALTPEQYVEIADDGWKVFSCMTEEELARFQKVYLPALLP